MQPPSITSLHGAGVILIPIPTLSAPQQVPPLMGTVPPSERGEQVPSGGG